jgi:hypothetical protein
MINSITLLEITDMLADKLNFDDVYAGNIDASKEKSIGVYYRDGQTFRKCVGGTESSYQTVSIRILIHWTNNPTEAEKQSYTIARLIENLSESETAEHIIKFADIKAIRSIGKDEKGICEFIVDADIIYTERT